MKHPYVEALVTALLVFAVMGAIFLLAYNLGRADQHYRDQAPTDTRQAYDPAAI